MCLHRNFPALILKQFSLLSPASPPTTASATVLLDECQRVPHIPPQTETYNFLLFITPTTFYKIKSVLRQRGSIQFRWLTHGQPKSPISPTVGGLGMGPFKTKPLNMQLLEPSPASVRPTLLYTLK